MCSNIEMKYKSAGVLSFKETPVNMLNFLSFQFLRAQEIQFAMQNLVQTLNVCFTYMGLLRALKYTIIFVLNS